MYPSGNIESIAEWLVGDVFLTNVYAVFDFGTNAATGGRIGFAQVPNAGFTSTSSAAAGQFSATSIRAVQALVGVAAVAAFLL